MVNGTMTYLGAKKASILIMILFVFTLMSVFGSYVYFQVQLKNMEKSKILCYLAGEIGANKNLTEMNQNLSGMRENVANVENESTFLL